ncbi:hypothetical protein AGMMS50256_08220 [Betaproteobacteria bacterium]|nr:hypothetical protein AGMMS50256_08220 [Betaproteobacteria bacterium]
MKKTIVSLLCLAALSLASTQAMALTETVEVEFLGPGGHSNGDYGRTSALHAAGRAVVKIKAALPAGSYVVTDMKGGNSVNSIASDGFYKIHLTAADQGTLNALKTEVTTLSKAGASDENAFRNVTPGQITSGVRRDIRVRVNGVDQP